MDNRLMIEALLFYADKNNYINVNNNKTNIELDNGHMARESLKLIDNNDKFNIRINELYEKLQNSNMDDDRKNELIKEINEINNILNI